MKKAPVKKSEPEICGARKKDGNLCQCTAINPINGRCRFHGGAVKRGAESHLFKTGKFCRLLPKKYQAAYRQSLDNPESLSLLDLIALTDSRIANLVSRLNQAGDEKTESVVWNKIIGLAQARMKLSEVETRRVLALTVTYVSRKEAFGLITALFESIKQHVNETTP